MKEETNYVGIIFFVAIAVIIGANLLGTIGQYTGQMTNTYNAVNVSVTTGANGAYVDLTGQNLIGTALVNNATYLNSNADGTGGINVTIEQSVSTVTGKLAVRMKTNNATWATKKVNVTYTYGADGYVDNAGARAIVPLIIVFFCLLIMVIAITPVFRNKLLDLVGLR